jgi:hypothetical protein
MYIYKSGLEFDFESKNLLMADLAESSPEGIYVYIYKYM